MRNAGLDEAQAEIKLLGEISITSEMQMIAPYQTKIMASGPITLWQIDGETVETVRDFILGGLKMLEKKVQVIIKQRSKGKWSE